MFVYVWIRCISRNRINVWKEQALKGVCVCDENYLQFLVCDVNIQSRVTRCSRMWGEAVRVAVRWRSGRNGGGGRERPGVLSTDMVENVAVGLCWRTEPHKTLSILTHAQWLGGCCSERLCTRSDYIIL